MVFRNWQEYEKSIKSNKYFFLNAAMVKFGSKNQQNRKKGGKLIFNAQFYRKSSLSQYGYFLGRFYLFLRSS